MILLAEGSYAQVYMDKSNATVTKIMPRYQDGTMNYRAITDLCIQNTFANCIDGIPRVCSYKIDQNNIIIKMPLYGRVLRYGSITEDRIMDVIKQLVRILLQLEECGVQHTDIKPNNVLYDKTTKQVTLIDYNMVSMRVTVRGKSRWTMSYGTWNYCAPEIILFSRPSDTSSVWSVAMLMAYLYARNPYPDAYEIDQDTLNSRTYWKNKIRELVATSPHGFPLHSDHINSMSPNAVDIFKQCTKWNHRERISLADLYVLLGGDQVISIHREPQEDVATSTDPMIQRLRNISRVTGTTPVLAQSVRIYIASNPPAPQAIRACASHYLALMLAGHNVFEDALFIEHTCCYWNIYNVSDVETEIWNVLDILDYHI